MGAPVENNVKFQFLKANLGNCIPSEEQSVQKRVGFNPKNRAGSSTVYLQKLKIITDAWFFITYTSYASC